MEYNVYRDYHFESGKEQCFRCTINVSENNSKKDLFNELKKAGQIKKGIHFKSFMFVKTDIGFKVYYIHLDKSFMTLSLKK